MSPADKISSALTNLSMAVKNLRDAIQDLPPTWKATEELQDIKEEIVELETKLLHVKLNHYELER